MPSPPAHAFLPLALASLAAPAPGRDSSHRRGGPATGSEGARAWQKGARELYFLFHFGPLGRERKRRKHAPFFLRAPCSTCSTRCFLLSPPAACPDRALASCSSGRERARASVVSFEAHIRVNIEQKKKNLISAEFIPFQPSSLSPSMGDDHGPAVGDDFKYSTGLTTAGENSLERGLQRDGVGIAENKIWAERTCRPPCFRRRRTFSPLSF